jgi:hypothetical protein
VDRRSRHIVRGLQAQERVRQRAHETQEPKQPWQPKLGPLETILALLAIGAIFAVGRVVIGSSNGESCEEIRAENGPYAYCADDPRKGHRPPLISGS